MVESAEETDRYMRLEMDYLTLFSIFADVAMSTFLTEENAIVVAQVRNITSIQLNCLMMGLMGLVAHKNHGVICLTIV